MGETASIVDAEEPKKAPPAPGEVQLRLVMPPPPVGTPPPPPVEESASAPAQFRVSIGTKFLALILSTLLVAVSIVVINATHLFQKDNLNNIYVASDMLTAAKAGEVRAWIDSLLQKGAVAAKLAAGQPATASDEIGTLFKTDTDVLAVTLYENDDPNNAPAGFHPKLSWRNEKLLATAHVSADALTEEGGAPRPAFEKTAAGAVDISSRVLADGQSLLRLSMPASERSPGVFNAIVTLVAREQRLLESFSDSGGYTLALVDGAGTLLAHPDAARVRDHESLASLPIVKKMRESKLDREFQEFTVGAERFLGSYAKVGIAGLGVISQIPRSKAFEAGQTLIRRSILISLAVLSAAFILAYLFAQTLVAPIQRLSKATAEIARGNFSLRVSVHSRDEISQLASGFNAMSSEIDRKIQNLSKINESSKIISSTLDSPKLVEFSLDTFLSLLHARQGVAWLFSETGTGRAFVLRRNWAENAASDDAIFERAARFTQTTPCEIASLAALVIPIQQRGKIAGYYVIAGRDGGKAFTDEDVFTAGTINTSVGITFENIRLLRETADKARMEKELETAKLVQDTMFPPTEILRPGLEIQSFYTPAGECGGDWWGILELPDGKVLLAIGDATGHGVPAALVTATAKAACSVIHRIAQDVPNLASSPGRVLHFLNKAIYESTLGKILMTFFVAVLDPKTGEVTYATASHDPIYWYKLPPGATPENGKKDNIAALLSPPGPRLGQQAEAHYEDATSKMSAGDFLLLYTDGLPEGKSTGGEEYGERKFLRSIGKHAHVSPKETRDRVLADFNGFITTEPLHDDVTLVVCKFKPQDAA